MTTPSSSPSDNDEPFSICKNLKWIFRCQESLWWPAIEYDNYGELLRQLTNHGVDTRIKVSLVMAAMNSNNEGKVARLIGVEPFKVLPLSLCRNKDFYGHLGQMIQQATQERYGRYYEAFQRAMDLTMQYMKNEMRNDGQVDMDMMEQDDDDDHYCLTQPSPVVGPETPTTSETSEQQSYYSPPEIHGTPIRQNDSWDDTWDKMRHSGWDWVARSNLADDYYYVKPGGSIKNGVEGEDFFTSMQHVQEYARLNYDWQGGEDYYEGSAALSYSSSTGKQDYSIGKSKKRKSDKGRVWGREKKKKGKYQAKQESKSPEMDHVEESEDEEDNFYVWNILWDLLKSAGWKAIRARNPLHDWYYVRPGKVAMTGNIGEDYFLSPEDVIQYARSIDLQRSYRTASSAPRQEQSRSISSSETPDRKPQPQDPGAALLSPSDVESEADDERYEWGPLWKQLKQSGWKYAKATNLLHDWYYVRPGRKVKGGKAGVDYFVCPEDVIEHVKQEDERDDQNGDRRHSPLGLELEQEASASEEDLALLLCSEEETISSTDQWWKYDPVPQFNNEVWPVLKEKMHFRYKNGHYILPGVSLKGIKATGECSGFKTDFFTNEKDMRIYMCKSGIPNFEGCTELTDEEKEMIIRWVTFSNVPVTDQSSISRLENVPVLSSQAAWEILSTQLGYKQVDGKFVPPYAEILPGDPVLGKHYFDTLDQLRCFIRASEKLDGSDVVEGLSRSRKRSSGGAISGGEILSLRLWAALSPSSLPVHPHQEQSSEEGTTQVKENNAVATSVERSEHESGNTAESTSSKEATTVDRARRITMDPSEFSHSVAMGGGTAMPRTTPLSSVMYGIHHDDSWHDAWGKMK